MRTSLHSSGRLGRLGALRNPGMGRARAWIAGVVALGLALAALAIFTAAHDRAVSAEDLMRLTLVGPRPPTCERVVVLPDVSGSMTDYAKVRENAMSTLAAWAPINLRVDDQLAIVRWADTAAIDAQPTEVSSMAASTFTPGTADVGGGNDIVPSVEEVASMSETSCHTSLIYISDGEITTPADQGRLNAAIRAAGVDRVGLLLPTAGSTPEYWLELFPYSQTFYADPDDPKQTARALGQAIASATGQQLELRP